MNQPNYLKIKLYEDITKLARNYAHLRYDSKYLNNVAYNIESGKSYDERKDINEIKMVAEDVSLRAGECIRILNIMEKKIIVFVKFMNRFIKG